MNEIAAVYVHPKYVQRGIGRSLFFSLVEGLRVAGCSSASLVAQCSKVPFVGCVLGHREDRTVRFILPPGYKRVDFSLVETNKEGHSGGRATWASADPHDASIAIHAWADAFSKIEIVVSNVIGEKE